MNRKAQWYHQFRKISSLRIRSNEITGDRTYNSEASTDENERCIFGATDLGFMIRSKKWKYCKYQTGANHLFDLENDPKEQQNLFECIEYKAIVEDLDRRLMKRLMHGIMQGNNDKKVDFLENGGKAFHERGWKRTYPHSN